MKEGLWRMFNREDRKYKLIRSTFAITLLAYLTFLAWRMFFYAYANYHRVQNSKIEYNLMPFKTILSLLGNYDKYSLTFWIYNLLGNVVVFIPLGVLLMMVLKQGNIKNTLGISFLIIVLAESIQLVTRLGVFDVDDIILNLLGCLIGYAIGLLIRKSIYKF
jgi:glycopeptide antibiotics resistance protein